MVSETERARAEMLAARVSVAIVTALTREYAAVQVMLDGPVEYSTPGKAPGEYILGEVESKDGGTHAVVAVCVGMGENAAASRLALLLERFPKVESVLMVGIAGAAPDPTRLDHDVRLGDIVVSDSRGVIQYDFDKETLSGGILKREPRFPPRPPGARLLDAIAELERLELHGTRPWEAYFKRASRLKWTRRPSAPDVLHVINGLETAVNRVKDPYRYKNKPKIFRGPIASGNKLLKNSRLRDELRSTYGVKAVEMEASGVAEASWLNSVGYLVVRGTCDYCDENKSDTWQGYAAMIAAAYARTVLKHVRSADRGSRPDVRQGNSPAVATIYNLRYDSHVVNLPKTADIDNSASSSPDHESIAASGAHVNDWGSAPDVRGFLGRTKDLTTLRRWALSEHCNIIGILGMGGIGKTALALTLARELSDHFDRTKWISLHGVPPISKVLDESILFFAALPLLESDTDIEKRVDALLQCFRERRCLLILDNLDTPLRADEPDYIHWVRLFRVLGETKHHSCVLFTTREKPVYVQELEGRTHLVRAYKVLGLPQRDGLRLIAAHHLSGSQSDRKDLWRFYFGNPLAIKLAISSIFELYNGNIGQFLEHGPRIFGSIHELLERQMQRLSTVEKSIVYWLAIEGAALKFETLWERISDSSLFPDDVRRLVERLLNRSLVEIEAGGSLFLQAVVTEFIIERLTAEVIAEINGASFGTISSYALMIARAEENLRNRQCAVILRRIVSNLKLVHGDVETRLRLHALLHQIREQPSHKIGYAAGNVLNLLSEAGGSLVGVKMHGLQIRQAYFVTASLCDVNAAGAVFHDCAFANTFDNILSIDIAPTRSLFAIGTSGGEVRVFRLSDLKEAVGIVGHSDRVWCVTFSPDAQVLASSGDDGLVQLWDVETGRLRGVLTGHTGPVRAVAFSPNGKTVASGGNDGTLRLWDAREYQCQHIIEQGEWIWSVAFSPGGDQVACGLNNGVVSIFGAMGRGGLRIQGHDGAVRSVCYSQDGRWLASGGNDSVARVWETTDYKAMQAFGGHCNRVRAVALSSDSRVLATGSDDCTIRLWDLVNGTLIRTLQGHSNQVTAIAFNPDGRTLASGSDDHTARIWEIRSGLPTHVLRGYTNSARCVVFAPHKSWLIAGFQDNYVRIWDTTGWRPVTGFRCDSAVRGIATCADGAKIITVGEERNVKIWLTSTGACARELIGHSNWVRSTALSPDGCILATGSEDRTVRLWDMSTGAQRGVLVGHSNWVRCVAFGTDGRSLASSSDDHTVRIWDVVSGRLLRVLGDHEAPVRSITYGPHQLATASDDGKIKIYSTMTWQLLCAWTGHDGWISSVSFSQDGAMLASGGFDRTARLWEPTQGRELAALEGHDASIRTVSFSPDSRLVVSGDDSATIRVWRAKELNRVALIRCNRPYERMDITNSSGLSDFDKRTLERLGAIDHARANAGSRNEMEKS